jgi:hypothetical protein
MEFLTMSPSPQTPYIHFDAKSGTMEIKGRSIPDKPEEFWAPVLSWFESYLMSPQPKTTVKIDLEYFNISSSKRILFLLYKLNDLIEEGLIVKVEWHYRNSDEDMFEVGQDYAFMVKVPFEFKAYEDPNFALAN